jgi:hypothetical protein
LLALSSALPALYFLAVRVATRGRGRVRGLLVPEEIETNPPPSPLVRRFLEEREQLLATDFGRYVLYTSDWPREIGDDEMTLYALAKDRSIDDQDLFIACIEPPIFLEVEATIR